MVRQVLERAEPVQASDSVALVRETVAGRRDLRAESASCRKPNSRACLNYSRILAKRNRVIIRSSIRKAGNNEFLRCRKTPS